MFDPKWIKEKKPEIFWSMATLFQLLLVMIWLAALQHDVTEINERSITILHLLQIGVVIFLLITARVFQVRAKKKNCI